MSEAQGWWAWWQLLRAANVFTAASNVVAGSLLVTQGAPAWTTLGLLVGASALLYLAGMALNDAFDAELDSLERPERPIPSGRILQSRAFAVGWLLLGAGVFMSACAAWHAQRWGPLLVASCLAVTIVLYDMGLKQLWAGPWAMGWCRFLNVALGASAFGSSDEYRALAVVASAIGLYTVGLTYVAQSEAGAVRGVRLRVGEALVVAALAMLAVWGALFSNDENQVIWFAGLAASLYLVGGLPPGALWRGKTTGEIRRQVGRLIVGFLVLDAWVAGMCAGWPAALAIVALIVPMRLAARRAPMT